MICTECSEKIEKGQPYCKTRKGAHHFKCQIPAATEIALCPHLHVEAYYVKNAMPFLPTKWMCKACGAEFILECAVEPIRRESFIEGLHEGLRQGKDLVTTSSGGVAIVEDK